MSGFCGIVRSEFVPFDSERLARDRLRTLKQVTSTVYYLDKFRNTVLTIPGMSEGEKLDRLRTGLKPQIRLEVMKSGKTTFDEGARIALNVDSTLYGSGVFLGQSQFSFRNVSSDGPVPMDIGNLQRNTGWERTDTREPRNNACWVCKKEGCRSWKHPGSERMRINNVGSGSTAEGSASSKN